MNNSTGKLALGVVLVIVALLLARQSFYTSIKSAVVSTGAPISVAVFVAWCLILSALVSGIVLIRRA
jgi:hypothetical protein